MLKATNRLAEAETFLRRVVEILLQFNAATGHEHPHFRSAIANYTSLLEQMGYNQAQVTGEIDKLGGPFGIRLGSDT